MGVVLEFLKNSCYGDLVGRFGGKFWEKGGNAKDNSWT
jgi:hypothetical protein